MTWHRPDGTTYRDTGEPTLDIPDRVLPGYRPPRAAVSPSKAPEPDRTPVHTARHYLTDVLARIGAGELGALTELPGAMAAARKESRQ